MQSCESTFSPLHCDIKAAVLWFAILKMSATADAVLIATGCCTGIQQLLTMTQTTTREDGQEIHSSVSDEQQHTTTHHSLLELWRCFSLYLCGKMWELPVEQVWDCISTALEILKKVFDKEILIFFNQHILPCCRKHGTQTTKNWRIVLLLHHLARTEE